MKRLTIDTLKNYSTWFDYNLTENQLKKVYEELTWFGGPINQTDILEEFEKII